MSLGCLSVFDCSLCGFNGVILFVLLFGLKRFISFEIMLDFWIEIKKSFSWIIWFFLLGNKGVLRLWDDILVGG